MIVKFLDVNNFKSWRYIFQNFSTVAHVALLDDTAKTLCGLNIDDSYHMAFSFNIGYGDLAHRMACQPCLDVLFRVNDAKCFS